MQKETAAVVASADFGSVVPDDSLRRQHAHLIEILFIGAECAATGLQALRRECLSLFGEIRLADLKVSLEVESSSVLTLTCTSVAAFDYFTVEIKKDLLDNRLQQALVLNGLHFVALHCATRHKTFALKLAADRANTVKQRQRKMRKLLTPLFEESGTATVIPGSVLAEFIALAQESPRLQEKLQNVDWIFDETSETLLLQSR